jgi:hypothetical protein
MNDGFVISLPKTPSNRIQIFDPSKRPISEQSRKVTISSFVAKPKITVNLESKGQRTQRFCGVKDSFGGDFITVNQHDSAVICLNFTQMQIQLKGNAMMMMKMKEKAKRKKEAVKYAFMLQFKAQISRGVAKCDQPSAK